MAKDTGLPKTNQLYVACPPFNRETKGERKFFMSPYRRPINVYGSCHYHQMGALGGDK